MRRPCSSRFACSRPGPGRARQGAPGSTVLAVGALSAAGLWYASYLNAVSALAMLPVFLLDGRYRTRQKGVFLGVVLAVSLHLRHPYLACQGTDGSAVRADELHHGHRTRRGALCPAHGRPGYLRVLSRAPGGGPDGALCRTAFRAPPPVCPSGVGRVSGHGRGDPGDGPFFPQPVSGAAIADMRYVAPLIVVGAAVTSVCLVILWDLSRPLACLAAILVVMTNALTLSWVALPQVPLRSTLLSYIAEGAQDYKTGTEALVEAVASLPPLPTLRSAEPTRVRSEPSETETKTGTTCAPRPEAPARQYPADRDFRSGPKCLPPKRPARAAELPHRLRPPTCARPPARADWHVDPGS